MPRTDTTIAEAIVQQLGASTRALLGAHNFISNGPSVSFRIRGSRKTNGMRITLTPADTYDIEFLKVGRRLRTVAAREGVSAEQLHQAIEAETGLCASF